MTSKRWQAFKEAAEHMSQAGWASRPDVLVLRHQDTWTLIWKAARKAERSKNADALAKAEVVIGNLKERLEQTRDNIDGLVATAKKRLEKINELEVQVEADRNDLDLLNQRLESTRSRENGRLANVVRERDDFKLRRDEYARANTTLQLTNTSLRRELDELKKKTADPMPLILDLNQAFEAHKESGRQEEREKYLKILAEEKALTSSLKREVEQLKISNELLKASNHSLRTEKPATWTCNRQHGDHKCKNQVPVTHTSHPQRHHCHCGHIW